MSLFISKFSTEDYEIFYKSKKKNNQKNAFRNFSMLDLSYNLINCLLKLTHVGNSFKILIQEFKLKKNTF